ncbi:hypothetical protein NPIL_100171 [Nephila pilipes]|uniref:Uncharacterized protein n=1 Tax=Nephila pilipes TaxID=299642 RepID=A0A8X6NSQ1_NEPPI|nr:hypothetical protein NPIL_100171 [Nephila pilipes]
MLLPSARKINHQPLFLYIIGGEVLCTPVVYVMKVIEKNSELVAPSFQGPTKNTEDFDFTLHTEVLWLSNGKILVFNWGYKNYLDTKYQNFAESTEVRLSHKHKLEIRLFKTGVAGIIQTHCNNRIR